ncbi:ABC-2 type transport system ATP-binding protein/heme exporter protein A [Thermosporothrix hazakensis]|jgi:heme ABC exporter ATP-binding subunit CcmA|uniref:ABC-2 type transport system ATP-binding protein/heme exporter protein A n=2 Tax=Thermosporothrix TaxID=768650 RepID=A0A326U9Q0_THEHA|nr:heme ABC exporter ATP-binding protein CcmA [Thermosporothrix hazakensis]PZW23929.1 ABC-2 type transport system ATP-binding protein/heme exporter protein A [Thermosporothrix hazakensis]BBH90435.1 ABC transporter ATP-binding protein [Thermosporothrix sp. COM3]GCE48472.1 ABC transporter ATP-binding protein [Thermosporothrix hazakensis]
MSALVEIRRLRKSFGLKPVLRGVDLMLGPGERLALLGANGAGKTTLLRILACLTRPGGGTVTVAGLDSVRDAQQIRRLVGFVGHQAYLYEELTALENLTFFGRLYDVAQADARGRALLERLGLARRMHDRVATFSRGMIQRVAWARALLHAPRLLLLDEPDTGLDQEGQQLIDVLVQEHIEQGGGAIFTTHQLERALQLSERIVLLKGGKVALQDATEAISLADVQEQLRV